MTAGEAERDATIDDRKRNKHRQRLISGRKMNMISFSHSIKMISLPKLMHVRRVYWPHLIIVDIFIDWNLARSSGTFICIWNLREHTYMRLTNNRFPYRNALDMETNIYIIFKHMNEINQWKWFRTTNIYLINYNRRFMRSKMNFPLCVHNMVAQLKYKKKILICGCRKAIWIRIHCSKRWESNETYPPN